MTLVGMYPVPIFSDEQKKEQNNFSQNIAKEPLAIIMYNVTTGAQEGKLSF